MTTVDDGQIICSAKSLFEDLISVNLLDRVRCRAHTDAGLLSPPLSYPGDRR